MGEHKIALSKKRKINLEVEYTYTMVLIQIFLLTTVYILKFPTINIDNRYKKENQWINNR